MSFRVRITNRAHEQIISNARWWAEHHDVNQAIVWHDGVYDEIDTLAEHPARCPLAVEDGSVSHELRQLNFGVSSRPTHRILFTIQEAEVVVLAVYHAAQDTPDPGHLELG